ncbi:MAG: hypothetical protein M3O23_04420 [Actinomycetota bacterium]|nr:hypothetical protein [Actinomycetota bacterium]
MTDRQDPLEQLLDLLVYAPLGLALSARDLLPALAERGRRHLGPQATAARMVGELAVTQGQRGLEHLVRKGRRQAEQLLTDLLPQPPAGPDGPEQRADRRSEANGAATLPAAPVTGTEPRPAPATSRSSPRPDASQLAIPGYDTLSASQVVQRLEGLTRTDMEAVRAYEQAGRARKTVLTRIAQLMDQEAGG